MGTVAETAVSADTEDLPEIMAHLFFLEVDGTKTLDTRGVNDRTALRQEIHLREGRGMHTCVMRVGDLAGAREFLAEECVQ